MSAIFSTPFENIKTNLCQRKPKINGAVFVSTGGCVETIKAGLNLKFDQNVDIFLFYFLSLTFQAQKNAMASVLELIWRCFGAGEAFYLVQ